jgi:hypothetical protein
MLPYAGLGSSLRKNSLHPNIPENTKNSRKICKTGNFRGRGEEIYMYCTGRTESSYYSLGQHFNQFYRGGAEGGGGGQGERGVNKFQPEQLELET